MLSAYKNTAYVLLGGALCKAWQLVFSCFSLCALVKRCLGKEKQHHRSIGRRLRRLMTLWRCFDVGTPARARTGDLGLRRLALYPTELQTHTVYGRRNCAIVFYLLMCDAVKGAFRRRRRAFFRKRRCNRIHRVIFLAYMDESPVKLNRNIRMKEPCVIHGL